MSNASLPNAEPDATVIAQFRTFMDNDLDTSSAMALIFDAVRRANIAAESGDIVTTAALASAVTEMTQALGLELSAGDDIDEAIVERANALDAARKAKDFAQADEIRNELQAAGYVVETTKDGTRVRRS
jgi:cysteinyl-tRNA synthetase